MSFYFVLLVMKFLRFTALHWAGLWYSRVEASGTELEKFSFPCGVVHGRIVSQGSKEDDSTKGLFQKKDILKAVVKVHGNKWHLSAPV